jgi:hypothetical protein
MLLQQRQKSMSLSHWNLILAWALAAFFILGGVINVLALGSTAAEYRRWGYPDWFHFVTGALEFATAVLLAFAATRAAVATVTVHGEYVRATPPMVVLLLLAVVAITAL